MVETSPSLLLLLLTMTLRGSGVEWNVTYSPTSICALEGSSVNMSCSYTYPTHLKVTDAFWMNQDSVDPVDLSKIVNYKHRVTANCGDKSILEVVSSNKREEVKEGDHVTLTCSTTCNLTGRPSFIWRKDGRPVEKKQSIHNQLQLHPVSIEDGGNYTCAVRGQENHPSPSFQLQVMLSPGPVFPVLVGVSACGAVGVLCVLIWLRFHKRSNGSPRAAAEDQDDGHYCNVNVQRSGPWGGAAHPPSAEAAGRLEDDDAHYSTIRFENTGAARSSPVQPEVAPYVIYSNVQNTV